MWKKLKDKENFIWAFLFSVLCCTVISLFFDYYYDINDDVLMKDIVAGVYSGTPSGYNVQMLYPLSFLLSLLYRITGAISWYGLFFQFCHFGSIYLITKRALSFVSKRWQKAGLLLAESLGIAVLLLQELVFVQYTVTVSVLAAAAAFLFYTSETDGGVKEFIKTNLLSIFLVILAFCIRSEMMLLMLPFICVVGVCKWAAESPIFTRKNAAKYFSVFGAILAGMLLSQGIHTVAYSVNGWDEFNDYFNERTTLYDFLVLPEYEMHKAFYDTIGLTKGEYTLLANYNFTLSEEIDTETLAKICDYVEALNEYGPSFTEKLRSAFAAYKYRTFHDMDYPYNMLVIAGYLIVLAAPLFNRRYRFLWELVLLGGVRSGLWMYILYRGRAPERITHSLYIIEFVILMAFLLVECRQKERIRPLYKYLFTAAICMLFTATVFGSVEKVQTEYVRREQSNPEFEAFKEYAKEREENYYFMDVFSIALYSEKIFKDTDTELDNYDFMGGWLSKSPLMVSKHGLFGITNVEEAICNLDNVFVVVKEPEVAGLPYIADWIPAYYEERGTLVSVDVQDIIYLNGEAVFTVYKIVLQ